MADDGDDDEWRFAVGDVGDDADDGGSDGGSDGYSVTTVGEDDDGPTVSIAEGDEGGNVAGSIAPDATVEPGTPDPENVVFVAAGALLTVLVFASLVVSLDPGVIAGATVAMAVAAGALYALFTRF